MEDDVVEFSARTVEDAIAEAEAHFGTQRSELAIEILSQGSRGVFGIGAENARIVVRGSSQAEDDFGKREMTEPALPEADTLTAQEAAPQNVRSDDSAAPIQQISHQETDLPAEASRVLKELLHSMGFEVEISVRNSENPLILAVTGQNLGVLIGRRGDNLASLQFMVNLILSKGRRQWPRVVVDVENYRARREESLRSLADRIAYRVGRNGRPFTLEAMPASDRRVIHLALRDRSDVETYSIGEGVSRRVVVAPKRSGHGYDERRR